ncbi:DUF262 domain-containing protein [Helicobacter ailurogastricus]|uniref:DUF262 domain-containing protein n=1 Tax=Helicobacter ailurogastricus TaxID=1578720 RepID=UPI000CF177EC|nr:DUF262 domain-containing protein [Helicobacter ailurogastricus]
MQVFSLKGFLEKHKAVKIPMLQRDYAQGRKSQESTARVFLNVLFNTLRTGQKLHLDFIYGYEENESFIPIDGQQRLTTLWLLYFYCYKRANQLDKMRGLLKKFTYATRTCSKKFCQILITTVDKDFKFDEESPSEMIKNMGGTFGTPEDLQNDPTIKAMLHMLDLIHKQYQKHANIALEHLEHITFSVFNMNMGKSKLGEELYIKMNARGKQLSPYENLKAFIQAKQTIPPNLLENMDNKWSDHFFDGKPKNLNERGLCFLHYANVFFRANKGLMEISNSDLKTDRPIDAYYDPLQEAKNIELLDAVVDVLQEGRKHKLSKPGFFNPSFFGKSELGYKELCYFFALLFFVQQTLEQTMQPQEMVSRQAFLDYFRVCKHLIENHRLDKPYQIGEFFKLFKFISKGCLNIYEFLSKPHSDEVRYTDPKNPKIHTLYPIEKRKAQLILKDRQIEEGCQGWEEILNETSEHAVLCGWVDFLLDFAKDSEEPDLEKFRQYAHITMQIYTNKFLKDDLILFLRTFLCMGDYGFDATKGHGNYFYGNDPFSAGDKNIDIRNKEAVNRLLSGKDNDQQHPYFKDLLDRLLERLPLEPTPLQIAEHMQIITENVVRSADFTQRAWYEQLLIDKEIGEVLFQYLNETKEPYDKARRLKRDRVPQEKKKRTRSKKNGKKLQEGGVYLLHTTRYIKDTAIDFLDYAFYLYCAERCQHDAIGEYCFDKIAQDGPKERFKISSYPVIADSKKCKISFNQQDFIWNQDQDIISFFEETLNEIKKILEILN